MEINCGKCVLPMKAKKVKGLSNIAFEHGINENIHIMAACDKCGTIVNIYL